MLATKESVQFFLNELYCDIQKLDQSTDRDLNVESSAAAVVAEASEDDDPESEALMEQIEHLKTSTDHLKLSTIYCLVVSVSRQASCGVALVVSLRLSLVVQCKNKNTLIPVHRAKFDGLQHHDSLARLFVA